MVSFLLLQAALSEMGRIRAWCTTRSGDTRQQGTTEERRVIHATNSCITHPLRKDPIPRKGSIRIM